MYLKLHTTIGIERLKNETGNNTVIRGSSSYFNKLVIHPEKINSIETIWIGMKKKKDLRFHYLRNSHKKMGERNSTKTKRIWIALWKPIKILKGAEKNDNTYVK